MSTCGWQQAFETELKGAVAPDPALVGCRVVVHPVCCLMGQGCPEGAGHRMFEARRLERIIVLSDRARPRSRFVRLQPPS